MGNQSFYLFQLQKLDRQVDQAEIRLKQIQEMLGNDQSLIAARHAYEQSLTQFMSLTDKLAEVEKKSNEKRIKIELSESSLYGGTVKNPKELTDLQQEIASLKTNLRTLENEQLELMIQSEDQKAVVDKSKLDLDTALVQVESKNQQLISEEKDLLNMVDRTKLERSAIIQQISPESLVLYESLRKSKKGIAVAGVEDQCCTVCGSQLTPSEIQQAKSSTSIARCSSCGRILYAD